MKTKFISILAVLALFVSCDKNNADGDGTPLGNGTPLKPEEGRVRLEQIGQEAIALINPQAQAELLEVIDALYATFNESSVSMNARKAADALLKPMKSVGEGDFKEMVQYATAQNTYVYGVEDILGVYTHDGSKWTFAESKTKCEFNFKVNGTLTVISMTPSGTTYSYTHEGYNYEYDNWTGEETRIPYSATVNVPGTIKAIVVKGDKTLADLSINGQYRIGDNSPIFVNVDLTLGTWKLDFDVNLTTASVTRSLVVTIGGKTLVNSSFQANGSFNLNPDYYQNVDDFTYYTDVVKVKDANIKEQILDFAITVGCKNAPEFEKEIWKLIEEEYTKNAEFTGTGTPYGRSEKFAMKYCVLLNNQFTNEASIGGTPFALVTFVPQYYDEDYWFYSDATYQSYELHGYYEPLPVLKFNSDGAQFSIDEFFNQNDFNDVVYDWDELVILYENCIPNIIAGMQEEPEYDYYN